MLNIFVKKLASANFAIDSSKHFLPLKVRRNLYYSMFDSHLNFRNLLKRLEILQKNCIRNVSMEIFRAHTETIFKELEILKFTDKLSY